MFFAYFGVAGEGIVVIKARTNLTLAGRSKSRVFREE